MLYIKNDYLEQSFDVIKAFPKDLLENVKDFESHTLAVEEGYQPLVFALSVRTTDNFVVSIDSTQEDETLHKYITMRRLQNVTKEELEMPANEFVMSAFAVIVQDFLNIGKTADEYKDYVRFMMLSQFQYLGYYNSPLSVFGTVFYANIVFRGEDKDKLRSHLNENCRLYPINFAKDNCKGNLPSLMKELREVKEA